MIKQLLQSLVFFLILFPLASVVHGQNYNMTNGSINTCSGNFYDSGGSGANYGNSQNFTQTFCSTTPGSPIQINFSAFNIENNYDFLTIYNGSSTTAPLIGNYTGTNSPGTVVASSGCITLRFTSDITINAAGWTAIISCLAPPPP
ncbi:MAG: hypothetical protein RLZZ630_1842, partial [Bacteroidota bacterium]